NTPHALADPTALQINEWLANSRSLYPDDFVELYNSSPAPVLLGGLHLSDEVLGLPERHQVTPLTFMAGRSHFVFIADGDEEEGADHLNFKLAMENGSIGLLDANTNVLDCISYGTQAPDDSEARRPSGANLISSFATPSPGAANPTVLGSVTVTSFSTSLLSTSSVWRYE